jgi:hypothetical protein
MYWLLLGRFHSLKFYGKLGRVQPVFQAYYKTEKLFFCGALVVFIRLNLKCIKIEVDRVISST